MTNDSLPHRAEVAVTVDIYEDTLSSITQPAVQVHRHTRANLVLIFSRLIPLQSTPTGTKSTITSLIANISAGLSLTTSMEDP